MLADEIPPRALAAARRRLQATAAEHLADTTSAARLSATPDSQGQHSSAKPGFGTASNDDDFEQEADHDVEEGVEH